jgi:SAM-dependent methyltransferase
MRDWLLQKITRQRLQPFLDAQATDARVLVLGASDRPVRASFPRSVRSDVLFYPSLDVQCDAHHLPFADNSQPVILALEMLEHCHTPQQVIDECYRVLQPGGQLILSTRFIFPLHDAPHDYYRYTKYGLRHLCRAFEQVTITEEAATVETMGVLVQRLAYQCDWHLPLTKIGLLLLAKLLLPLQRTLKTEYGDIRKDQPDRAILASGYYLTATKGDASA